MGATASLGLTVVFRRDSLGAGVASCATPLFWCARHSCRARGSLSEGLIRPDRSVGHTKTEVIPQKTAASRTTRHLRLDWSGLLEHRLPPPRKGRALALVVLAVVLLGVSIVPGAAKPVQWQSPSAAPLASGGPPPLTGEDRPGPVRVSLLDVLGKVGLAVLFIYAVAFALSRMKGLRSLPRWLPTAPKNVNRRLRVSETLPLSRQEGTLYLVEVDDHVMLVGACAEQLEVLWSPAPEVTSSFQPVSEKKAESRPVLREEALLPAEKPLSERGFGEPARREADWARERRRLINALMESE